MIGTIKKEDKLIVIDGLDHVENYNPSQLNQFVDFIDRLQGIRVVVLSRPLKKEMQWKKVTLLDWTIDETRLYLEMAYNICDYRIQSEIFGYTNGYERDLLVKKINDKIAKASFVDTIKPNEDKVYAKRIDKAEYAKEAEAAYQQINDLIRRFQLIDAAIVESNAKTEVNTSYGTFTVAGAISLRSRLRGMDAYDGEADFEGRLKNKLNNEYSERVQFCDMKNGQLQSTAESMRLSILGRDAKAKDDKPLGVVDAYMKENTTELVDPLDVKKKVDMLEEKRNILLTELDTQIKVSNATTFIEIA